MDVAIISLIIAIAALAFSLFAILRRPQQVANKQTDTFETRGMQLQAYERLVLLTERLSLPNLISRLNQPGISAVEMKIILVENIKHEFDYNSTQQLYVSPISWDSVRNLKEQNIMIINQVANKLAPDASAAELNKKMNANGN